MAFGARLRALRLDRGLTQQQLAGTRYTPAFVSSLEADRRRPSPDAARYFADRLGVEIDELLTGTSPGARLELLASLQSARALLARGELAEVERIVDDAQSTASEQGWTVEMGRALLIRGLLREQCGDLVGAQAAFEAAEDALDASTLPTRMDALAGRARCLQLNGDIRYAIHLLETQLRLMKKDMIEDPTAHARVHASLVAAYFDAGLQKQAEASAVKVLELAPAVSDPDRLANMYINVARVFLNQRRFDDVRANLLRAEDLFIDLNQKNDLGRVYLGKGYSSLSEGRFEQAVDDLKAASDIFKQTGHVLNGIRTELQLARASRMLGRLGQAKLLLQPIVADEEGVGTSERGIAHRELGLCLLQDSKSSKAAEHLQKAVKLFERSEDARELAFTYRLLGDLMKEQDQLSLACDAYRSAALALEQAA